jgi:hypothetical protein
MGTCRTPGLGKAAPSTRRKIFKWETCYRVKNSSEPDLNKVFIVFFFLQPLLLQLDLLLLGLDVGIELCKTCLQLLDGNLGSFLEPSTTIRRDTYGEYGCGSPINSAM